MIAFLVFRLYGPLASWGEIAVGERRSSWGRPSKSAVTGLCGAALGIERADRERQLALARGYGFAVRVDAPGVPLRDYHTAQTAPESQLKKLRKADPMPLTRRSLLASDALETILSQRYYYADALCTAAIWVRDGAPYSLAEIEAALRQPRYVLYLGRKSCPPALPLDPRLIEADDLVTALASYAPATPDEIAGRLSGLNRRQSPALLAWEDDVVPRNSPAIRRLHQEIRRDEPTDRLRWFFAERPEHVGYIVPGV